MSETKPLELSVGDTIRLLAERPRFRVRRDNVKQLLPEHVRSATEIAEFFGISRATAWRLFLAPENRSDISRASAESVAAICAAFPDVPQTELVEVVR